MLLRDAIAIERKGPPQLGDYGGSRDSFSIFAKDADEWYRARSIVDAATVFIESLSEIEKDPENLTALHARTKAYLRFRDLENGDETCSR